QKNPPRPLNTAAAIAVRIGRAAPGPPVFTHDGSENAFASAARSSPYVTQKSAPAATTRSVGTNHRLVRNASPRHPGIWEPALRLPRRGSCTGASGVAH